MKFLVGTAFFFVLARPVWEYFKVVGWGGIAATIFSFIIIISPLGASVLSSKLWPDNREKKGSEAGISNLVTIWLGLGAALLVIYFDGGYSIENVSGAALIIIFAFILGAGLPLILAADGEGIVAHPNACGKLRWIDRVLYKFIKGALPKDPLKASVVLVSERRLIAPCRFMLLIILVGVLLAFVYSMAHDSKINCETTNLTQVLEQRIANLKIECAT